MNCFKFRNAVCRNLQMDGSFGQSNRFITGEPLEIQAGDRIIFGPMRPHQPVMGYFYDEKDQPLLLINHINAEIIHTFKEGMVMASILAPEGAAAIRLQLTIEEKDLFLIYINEEICAEEIPNEKWLGNPLQGKNVLNIGDSLCGAAKDIKVDGLRGWARRIRDHYAAHVFNAGIGGAALSDCRMGRERITQWHQIFRQVDRFEGFEFDYILLQGGANDCIEKAPIGQPSESFDPATFDLTTYAGGLEMLIYQAVKNYGNTAAIGYMSMYKTPHSFRTLFIGEYFEVGKAVCEKWGIAYLDTYNDLELDTITCTVDGGHANKDGYDVLGPFVNDFMLKMRPVPIEVWRAVQDT